MIPQRVRWLISGRVQGVGFRWFVYRQAERLGILGWVRNLPDGTVEVIGTGSPEALAEFEQVLSEGPVMARVDTLRMEEFPHHLAELKSFDIK